MLIIYIIYDYNYLVTECKPGSVPCRIGEPECVNAKQQNDGRIDCKDGSDEGN